MVPVCSKGVLRTGRQGWRVEGKPAYRQAGTRHGVKDSMRAPMFLSAYVVQTDPTTNQLAIKHSFSLGHHDRTLYSKAYSKPYQSLP
jgi:hypothetical protein